VTVYSCTLYHTQVNQDVYFLIGLSEVIDFMSNVAGILGKCQVIINPIDSNIIEVNRVKMSLLGNLEKCG